MIAIMISLMVVVVAGVLVIIFHDEWGLYMCVPAFLLVLILSVMMLVMRVGQRGRIASYDCGKARTWW